MEIKTFTYQRVLNLGNYESKRLEMSADIRQDEDADEQISLLMQKVERKIREEAHLLIELEIDQAHKELRELKSELRQIKREINTAESQPQDDQEVDDIPFEGGVAADSYNPADF